MADDKSLPPGSGTTPPTGSVAPKPSTTGIPSPTGTRPGAKLTAGGQNILSAPAPMTVTEGMLIAGTYEIELLISRGGMGEVYRGRNIHTGDPVAMKIVLPALAHDEMIEALFQKEAKVLGRLSHDAIVRYHTYMNPPEIGRPSLIMEFVEGKPLSERIKEGPMPEADLRVLLRRLASGLDRAHGAGVVHRDLSPDNVILEGGEVAHAKIIDFGIAKSSMSGDRTLLGGQFAGKFSFVAPEQLGAYDGEIDGRTDIYALALLVTAASRGKNLSMGASIIEAVRSRSSVPDISAVPEGLRPLIENMLQPDPAHRPASMAQVIRCLDDPSLIPPTPAEPGPDPDRTVIATGLTSVKSGPQSQPPATAAPRAELIGIPTPKPVQTDLGTTTSSNSVLIAGVLGALVVMLGIGGAYVSGVFGPDDGPTPDPVALSDPDAVRKAAEAAAAAESEAQAAAQAQAAADAQSKAAADQAAADLRAAADKAAAELRAAELRAAEEQAAADLKASQEAARKAAEEKAAQDAALAASDPGIRLEKQLEWLRTYTPGECIFLSVLGSSGENVALEGFGTRIEPFNDLLTSYVVEHQLEPDIGVRLIDDTQCPVVDFMNAQRENPGAPAQLMLENGSDVVKSGQTVSGRVEGLAGRAVSLFLVNGAGGATNLKPWLREGPDGSVGFSFTVNLAQGAEPTPQLIMAVITPNPMGKLDAVPNGVTARALVPFIKAELDREGQKAIGGLRFFRLEN